MFAHIKYIYFFCQALGYFQTCSILLDGLFTRCYWYLLDQDLKEHKLLVRKYLSDAIYHWSKMSSEEIEGEEDLESHMVFVCGFLIYAYAHDQHTEELFSYAIGQIDHKMSWLKLNAP